MRDFPCCCLLAYHPLPLPSDLGIKVITMPCVNSSVDSCGYEYLDYVCIFIVKPSLNGAPGTATKNLTASRWPWNESWAWDMEQYGISRPDFSSPVTRTMAPGYIDFGAFPTSIRPESEIESLFLAKFTLETKQGPRF